MYVYVYVYVYVYGVTMRKGTVCERCAKPFSFTAPKKNCRFCGGKLAFKRFCGFAFGEVCVCTCACLGMVARCAKGMVCITRSFFGDTTISPAIAAVCTKCSSRTMKNTNSVNPKRICDGCWQAKIESGENVITSPVPQIKKIKSLSEKAGAVRSWGTRVAVSHCTRTGCV